MVSIGPLPSIGSAERVDNPAKHRVTHGHRENPAGRADLVTLLDVGGVTKKNRTDGGLVEVQGDADEATGEFEKLGGHGTGKTGDAGNTVTDRGDVADGLRLDGR